MNINSEYVWGISQKQDGSMKIFPDDVGGFVSNRDKFFDKLGLDSRKIISAGLVHGDNIVIVDEKHIGQKIENTDGLITQTPDVILTVTVADCLPVYFFDKENGVVGLLHAGWRGVLKNIPSKMVQKLKTEFGADPDNLVIGIGPHIRDCHFEIQKDVADQFSDYKNFMNDDDGKHTLNLSGIVSEQLKNEGVLPENINISPNCTYCLKDKYYSFRRDKPETIEALVAYALIKTH